MRRELLCVLMAGLVVFAVAACSGGKKPAAPGAGSGEPAGTGATASATPPVQTCPVDQVICDFALAGEQLLRANDAQALVAAGHAVPETVRLMLDMLYATGGVPRLVSVGCPARDGTPFCGDMFAVAYSALPDGLEQLDSRGIDVATYLRTTGEPAPLALTFPEGADRAIVFGGGDSDSCALSRGPVTPGSQCPKFRFYPFAGVPLPPKTPPVPAVLPPLRDIPGASVRQMTLGEPYVIKPGEAWYYTYLCDACGPPPIPNLWRAYRAATGELVIDDLRERMKPLGTVVAFAADWDNGRAFVATCEGACGPTMEGGSHRGFGETVYESRDGGVSWRKVGQLPDATGFLGLIGDQVLTGRFILETNGPRFFFYPSGIELTRPRNIPADAFPTVVNSQTVLWRTESGDFFDVAGTLLFGPLFAERFPLSWNMVADPQYQHTYVTWAEWALRAPGEQTPGYVYIGHIDRDGQMKDAWALPGDTLWLEGEFRRSGDAPPALYGRFRFGTPGTYGSNTSFGAVLDLATAHVHPLAELTRGAPESTFVHIQGLVQLGPPERGPQASFLRVTGTGDCLNVREAPSLDAPVFACYADGVLFGQADQLQNFAGADNITWSLVITPDGRNGFASTEFLQ
jgi:hypothetical protein